MEMFTFSVKNVRKLIIKRKIPQNEFSNSMAMTGDSGLQIDLLPSNQNLASVYKSKCLKKFDH